jgi:imidazoleglycerol-phosphate dehydratase
MSKTRNATVERKTKETDIRIKLDLDKSGGSIVTGHGFLDHMLEQVSKHSKLYLDIQAKGDLHVDVHHLAEDTGIVLGQVLHKALGERVGIERYADAFVPMDETLVHVVLDLSGRAWISFEPSGFEGDANGFNVHHLREFLRGFANHVGATLHVNVLSGTETHHVCEAVIKAFARSLFTATRIISNALPSTKGLL